MRICLLVDDVGSASMYEMKVLRNIHGSFLEFKSNFFRSLSSLVNRNTLKAPTTSFLDYVT